ncbi:hypothetical protein QN277_009903 [Acacia crassicarpa]|uniref:Uncharacterized protein n=1 Tax=Acacia crassicarpa TaxID=499986 RepID=A0AAE1MCB4_9FABA|nr:hypothetical protein QN277_009903 [Acacia crassicarpa]
MSGASSSLSESHRIAKKHPPARLPTAAGGDCGDFLRRQSRLGIPEFWEDQENLKYNLLTSILASQR